MAGARAVRGRGGMELLATTGVSYELIEARRFTAERNAPRRCGCAPATTPCCATTASTADSLAAGTAEQSEASTARLAR